MRSSRIIQVGLLATYLRELIETNDFLQDVWVEGEISSFTVPGSGHAYFAIKDQTASVDCVMWKQTRLRQSFQPRVGDKVVVHGGATVYEKTARFQIKADVIYPAGAGVLQLQLEQLKQRLEAEGLFDPSRKRPLPAFPTRIGVVTSATGAVWHDIQRVLARRFPMVELVLSPAVVQGDRAPDSVVEALSRLQDIEINVIILARGGGSAEDLWAFNDERIARAIFASKVPVISAIGHDTDNSIADMVADLRAPTPSVAAELVAPDIADLSAFVAGLDSMAMRLSEDRIERLRQHLGNIQHRLALSSPKAQLTGMQAVLTAERTRMTAAIERVIERKAHQLDRAHVLLHALEPNSLLRRGFTHISLALTNKPVRSAGMLRVGDRIVATFADGSSKATVEDVTLAQSKT